MVVMRFCIGFGFAVLLLASPLAEAAERPVVVPGAEGASLAGTLTVPDRATGRVPALLLIQGSGPTDRDGNQPTGRSTDLLKQLAGFLDQRGIASLRLDKRGMQANKAQMPLDQAQMATFFQWTNFVGDAVAGYRFLADQPGIDGARTGILGHSEGGMLALAVSVATAADHPPALMILASTPGRPGDQVLREQIAGLLVRQKATPAATEFFMAATDRIQAGLRASDGAPTDVPPGLAVLFPAYLAPLHQEYQLDPAKAAARFAGPVLILQGGSDMQVSAERDAPALDRALAARRPDDHLLVVVPDVGHPLKPVGGPSDGPIAPGILAALGPWLDAHQGP
jgi:alpha-beta hydrolase superfamily lysophospholipase